MKCKTLLKKFASAFMAGVLLTGMLTISTPVSAVKANNLSNTALSLYDATYQSFVGRITGRGYTETSLTGAYYGMYLRDSAIQIMAHNIYGDYHLSREMLQFIIGQHQDLNLQYTQHILGSLNETTYNYDNTYLTKASAKTKTKAAAQSDSYLGCSDIGMGHWNIMLDYLWAPFTPDLGLVESVDAYVEIPAGIGTLTVGIYTASRSKDGNGEDVIKADEWLGEATLDCQNDTAQVGWQTLTFAEPVKVTPGETYYLRFGSDDVKVILYGMDSPVANDDYREWVDAGRNGSGWSNNRLVNFKVTTGADVDAYLGCTDIGMGHWNIQLDYLWAPFVSAKGQVTSVDAYVDIPAGKGTMTVGIYSGSRSADKVVTDELLGEATLDCQYDSAQVGWQTLTFTEPVQVTPGETYYLRFESNDIKVILYGMDSPEANDPYREWVDAGRSGAGWSNNRLVNFRIGNGGGNGGGSTIDSYLGCTDVDSGEWNIKLDYVYGAFVPETTSIGSVKAYVTIQPGVGSLTAGIYTDVYGHGTLLGEATIDCQYTTETTDWQTLIFDTPVKVTPGQTYYLRLGSEDVKVVLWGGATNSSDDKRAYVDADRSGGGWRTDFCPCFEIPAAMPAGSNVILTLDSNTSGAQIVPALGGKRIVALRTILGRSADATGILKATLTKGFGENAVRVDCYEMDIAKIPVGNEWVKLFFSLPVNEVDANQDYYLTLELVNATGEVYWYGTDQLDQYGTYAINGDAATLVAGEASFEAFTSSGASMWSNEIQPDGNYMFIHAWYQYATGCLDNEDNRTFIAESYPVIKTYANYYLDNGYIGDNGLIRNPFFEHSREGRKWNAYDLITNVFASQALYEMSGYAAGIGDTASAEKWMAASLSLEKAINEHLVVQYDGVDIYAELYDLDHDVFIPGISWVNLAPIAADWYGMNWDVMQNTLDLYAYYASDTFNGYEMLYSTGDLGVVTGGNGVIGKGLSWLIMYYNSLGDQKQVDYLLDFIETFSKPHGCYGESYYKDRVSDPGNQEHASWQFYAVSTVYPELTKNYSVGVLQALVTEADAVDVDRLRDECLGEPLSLVYALRDEANALVANERSTKADMDALCDALKEALDYMSYIDEPPHTRLLHTGGETSKMEMEDDLLGLAFRFSLQVDGASVNKEAVFDSSKATVDVAQTGVGYELVRMGAIVTNRIAVGEGEDTMTLDQVNGSTVKDVPATYLYSLKGNVASYAVRVTNIPRAHEKTLIYARPYYIYLFNGEEIVVYGDVYSESYTPKDSNDVTMDW